MQDFDIAIVGGGINGLTIAGLLKDHFSIALIDAGNFEYNACEDNHYDLRVSAITSGAVNVFSSIGIWENIKNKRVSPYYKMDVLDKVNDKRIEFDARECNQKNLGYIVENSLIQESLINNIKSSANVRLFSNSKLTELIIYNDHVNILLSKVQKHEIQQKNQQPKNISESIRAKLIIGADGGKSFVRQALNIDSTSWDYNHLAMVANLKTEKEHNNVARQAFLKDAILAFLPLKVKNYCSIVYSAKPEVVNKKLNEDDEVFLNNIEDDFPYLGKVLEVSKRVAFPLSMHHAKQYCKSRAVLIGDAAHTVHPLAGQGVNLGILDANVLANTLLDAKNKKYDIGNLLVLRKYELKRKTENFKMISICEYFKRVYANDKPIASFLSSFGMSLVNRSSNLKKLIVEYALH